MEKILADVASMALSLASALNWYQKKIGAYDKQSWEKTVDQRISRGVSAVPKKIARLKTELIDVDLVRGSAFPKAKPQHSWIAATSSGIIRVLFLPFFYSWWQQQTNRLVSITLVILYFLQMGAMYLFFSAEEEEFPDVPSSEILTPAAMMLVLGIVHSQIVATFSSKNSHKRVQRTKRKRVKRKSRSKTSLDYESKSSPETASEDKSYDGDQMCSRTNSAEPSKISLIKSTHTVNQRNASFETDPLENDEVANFPSKTSQSCPCRTELPKTSSKKNSDEESGLDSIDFTQPSEDCTNKSCSEPKKMCKCHHDSDFIVDNKTLNSNSLSKDEKLYSPQKENIRSSEDVLKVAEKRSSNLIRTNSGIDDENVSSGEEYFVAKKPSYSKEEWKDYLWRINSNAHLSKHCNITSKCENFCCHKCIPRRYSDVGPRNVDKQFNSVEKLDHRFSEDGILSATNNSCCANGKENCIYSASGSSKCLKNGNTLNTKWSRVRRVKPMPSSFRFDSSKRGCSSCESCVDTTSPNTPTKPQTSDLEWPIITNTDCNSDSSDCSSQSSQGEETDLPPSENPFAWEMQDPQTTFFNGGYTGSDKVSCTIWEHNECKKVDLTVLDISSAIIRKVDSSPQSTEYLAIGVIFAIIISFLPLLFRLQAAAGKDVIQDVTSDVLLLTVPSTDDVFRLTVLLQEVMLGSSWRVKTVVLTVMLERFTLSLAYFFLLSVAERTFKQRFLYAKHFCHLTSSRRARRSDLPHFRLNKVRNIKTWLSVRSYLKKHGPQRSVDVIVSIAFILEVCVLSFLCVQLLKETGHFADRLYCWETLCWNLAIGLFLLRFMIIGSKINKKYRNLSVLITEQINLYLHMEQKPHKKEELMLANSVLKLAADLLKELESPFKISGLCANPYLYNITKVVVLSAFSAVLTELLGFKLKLYKIKIK